MLAGCDTLSSLNPFDRTEKYKPEIVPEVPAEQLYNEGLARIQKEDYEGRRRSSPTSKSSTPIPSGRARR